MSVRPTDVPAVLSLDDLRLRIEHAIPTSVVACSTHNRFYGELDPYDRDKIVSAMLTAVDPLRAERDDAVARAERYRQVADDLHVTNTALVARAERAESLLDRARARLLSRITIVGESGERLAADLASGTEIQDDLRALADLLAPTTEETQ